MSDEEFVKQRCADCDIIFGISKSAEEKWRKFDKTFFCPNGHGLQFPKETKDENETLRAEIKELKAKLESALKDNTALTTRLAEVTLELEIWKPSDAKEIA